MKNDTDAFLNTYAYLWKAYKHDKYMKNTFFHTRAHTTTFSSLFH